MTQIHRDARIPLIEVGTVELIKRGEITVCPRVERFTEQCVVFADGRQAQCDTVVVATGYRSRVNAFLEGASAALGENGTSRWIGREAPIPSLYFCGYCVSPTGMLREIALEARRISDALARRRVTTAGNGEGWSAATRA